jgi:hypothetical protein
VELLCPWVSSGRWAAAPCPGSPQFYVPCPKRRCSPGEGRSPRQRGYAVRTDPITNPRSESTQGWGASCLIGLVGDGLSAAAPLSQWEVDVGESGTSLDTTPWQCHGQADRAAWRGVARAGRSCRPGGTGRIHGRPRLLQRPRRATSETSGQVATCAILHPTRRGCLRVH